MKAILILGAGAMQGPAMRIARGKGYEVHAADGNPRAACVREADVFHAVDLKDKEGLENAARSIPGLAGVFTAGTDFSASVAWVAGRLGLPGIPYEAALDASDKSRMRARLKAAGVPVPGFASGTAGDDPAALAAAVAPLPLVVKPVDNMGARGCRLARTPSELAIAWKDAVASSRTGRAIIEEYLDGPEFSLDAIVRKGRVAIRGVADRVIAFKPFFVELGHTMPTAFGDDIVGEVVGVFEAGIAALGISDGAAKGDIKYTRSGAYVGEIAARLSGGYMSGWTYPYSSGILPTAEAIDIACGVDAPFSEPSLDLVCSERAWISIPGRISKILGPAGDGLPDAGAFLAAGLSGIRDVFPRAEVGDRAVFPSNNVEKCGNVLAVAGDRKAADAAAEDACRSILVGLEPADAATAAFIRGEGRIIGQDGISWPPDAFEGLSAMTLASIDKMPGALKSTPGAASISIAPLPGLELEQSRDWLGRSIPEALAAVERLSGAKVGLGGDTVLGSAFWKAFVRGGYQAGAWVVETSQAEGKPWEA